MKKFLRKLPLFAVFAAVTGFAFYEYRKSLGEGDKKEGAPLIRGLLKDAERIRFSNKKSYSLLLVKEGGDWRLKEPFEDFADSEALSEWRKTLSEERLTLISDKPDIAWENYYLTEKSSSVEIRFFDSAPVSFSLSARPAFDGKWFVKKGGALYLAGKELGEHVHEKPLDFFRSKQLLHFFERPTEIRLKKKGAAPLNFAWKDSAWTFVGANSQNFPLDSSALNMFWTHLSGLKGSRFVPLEAEASSAAPKKSRFLKQIKEKGLRRPAIEITFGFSRPEEASDEKQAPAADGASAPSDGDKKAKDKNISVRFSALKNGKAFAVSSERDFILEISKKSDWEKIALSRNDIRDHARPFQYDKEAAFKIRLKSEKTAWTIQRGAAPSSGGASSSATADSDGPLASSGPGSDKAAVNAEPRDSSKDSSAALAKSGDKNSASSKKKFWFFSGKTKKDSSKKSESDEAPQWTALEPKGQKVRPQEVSALLNAAADLRGEKYRRGSLKKIRRSLEIWDSSGDLLFSLRAGDSYSEDEDDFFWTKTSRSDDKIAVLKESLDFVFDKKLLAPLKKQDPPKEELSKEIETKTETKTETETENKAAPQKEEPIAAK